MDTKHSVNETRSLLLKQRKKYLIIISILVLAIVGFITSTTWLSIKYKRAYPSARVEFHVWTHPEANLAERRDVKIKVPKNATVLTLLEHSAMEDSKFTYEYIQYDFGKYIKSIGGVSENVNQSIFWVLYKLDKKPSGNNPPTMNDMAQLGIDDLRIEDGDVFLYWLTKFDYEEGNNKFASIRNRLGSKSPTCVNYHVNL